MARRARNTFPRAEAGTVTASAGAATASVPTAPPPAPTSPVATGGFVPDKIEPGFEAPEPPGKRPARTANLWHPDAPPPPPPPPDSPVRVGGDIRPPTKVRDVKPVYPPAAADARAQGVVIAEATIGPDGSVKEARIVRSIPLLDQAALDAIRQWQYTPTLVNGVPTTVLMTVTVQFTLGR